MLQYIGSKLVNSNIENIVSGSGTGAPIDNVDYNQTALPSSVEVTVSHEWPALASLIYLVFVHSLS